MTPIARRTAPFVVAFMLVSACAARTVQQSSIQVYEVLAAVQDAEIEIHRAGQISEVDHARFNAVLVQVLEAGQAYNTVAARSGDPDIGPIADGLGRLAQEIGDLGSLSAETRATLASTISFALRLLVTLR